MSNHRSRGIVTRFRRLVHGMLSIWIRDSERGNPRAVYEQAIHERTRQYRDLKEAVAGILYMRNKLEAEITERRAEIARTHDDIRRAVRRGQDEASLSMIAHKQNLMDELGRAENDLEKVRAEAEEAKSNLVRFREEIRSLMREKNRVLASLANATARRRLQEAVDGLSVDADVKALESVRDHVARISTEGVVDREIGGDADVLKDRMRAIRADARRESAQAELQELKKEFAPRSVEETSAREMGPKPFLAEPLPVA